MLLKLDKWLIKVAKESGLSKSDLEVITEKDGTVNVLTKTARGKSFMEEAMNQIMARLAGRGRSLGPFTSLPPKGH